MNQSDLDELLRSARVLSPAAFRLLYGDLYTWFTADNSVRVASLLRTIPLDYKPFVKSKRIEHKSSPSKGELVVFINRYYDREYGKILWRGDGRVGIYLFSPEVSDTFDVDDLESVSGEGNIRWRIWQ